MKVHQAYTLCIFFLLLSSPVSAIVNVEDERSANLENGWGGSLNISGGGKSGNTDKESFKIGGSLVYHQNRVTWLNLLEASYGESSDVKDDEATLVHSRVTYFFTDRWAFESFIQYQQNEFILLNQRTLYGNGLRYEFWPESSSRSLALGTALMHEDEQLDLPGASGKHSAWRWSIYSVFNLPIGDDGQWSTTLYYQPLTERRADYRILFDTQLKIPLTSKAAITLGYGVMHDSVPAEQGLEETDRSYYTKWQYQF